MEKNGGKGAGANETRVKWLTEEQGNYEVVEEGQRERKEMRGDL